MLSCQLEDAEMATAAAIKARKGMEMELQDLQTQFEALSKSKQEVDVVYVYVCVNLLYSNSSCELTLIAFTQYA